MHADLKPQTNTLQSSATAYYTKTNLEVHLERRPVHRAGARQRGLGAARLEEAEEEEGNGEEGRGEERLVQKHLGRYVAGGWVYRTG